MAVADIQAFFVVMQLPKEKQNPMRMNPLTLFDQAFSKVFSFHIFQKLPDSEPFYSKPIRRKNLQN